MFVETAHSPLPSFTQTKSGGRRGLSEVFVLHIVSAFRPGVVLTAGTRLQQRCADITRLNCRLFGRPWLPTSSRQAEESVERLLLCAIAEGLHVVSIAFVRGVDGACCRAAERVHGLHRLFGPAQEHCNDGLVRTAPASIYSHFHLPARIPRLMPHAVDRSEPGRSRSKHSSPSESLPARPARHSGSWMCCEGRALHPMSWL